MKVFITENTNALLSEYKEKHSDWVLRMAIDRLAAASRKVMFVGYPCGEDADDFEPQDLASEIEQAIRSAKLQIELDAVEEALEGLVGKEYSDERTAWTAGALRIVEEAKKEAELAIIAREFINDVDDYIEALSICAKLLKLHLTISSTVARALD